MIGVAPDAQPSTRTTPTHAFEGLRATARLPGGYTTTGAFGSPIIQRPPDGSPINHDGLRRHREPRPAADAGGAGHLRAFDTRDAHGDDDRGHAAQGKNMARPTIQYINGTQVKRATKQKLDPNSYMAHAFHEDGGDSDSEDEKASALLITDAKREENNAKLAWDWPRRRDKVLKTMEEKMAVPNLLAIDLVNEWTRAAKLENDSMNRRMAAYMARERPSPKSLTTERDLLRSLADLALADAT